MKKIKTRRRLRPPQIILLGFFLLISCGTLLLMLPVSTVSGEGASFLDALFTATSASCVTGLIVHDTAQYWTVFGQAVIIGLIQIGGMGVITMAIFAAIISGKKIGLQQRSIMQESISAPQIGGIIRFTNMILKVAFTTELVAALIMAPIFCKQFGLGKGLWYALFHSISAFCNAGFDLMGVIEPYSSLTYYSAEPVINFVIMFLIIFGGIGFLTWNDMLKNRHHFRKYRLQSKIIIVTTLTIILVPALYMFIFEFKDYPLSERILLSLFQVVTPRTAGFNTADLNAMSESGQSIMIILMLIGGAPGSTAGGMKVTTAAVLLACTFSVFRNRSDANMFSRRIPADNIRYAAAIFVIYIILFLFAGFVISSIEGLPVVDCLYETASAIGTVGLTLGITPGLSAVSHVILISLMFLGRVGGLTLLYAFFGTEKTHMAHLPQEQIAVG